MRVFHVGTHRSRPFFTMELIAGEHLGELLTRRQEQSKQSAEQAARRLWSDLDLLRKLADAVHYAHTYGVLHRDLKPANILLDEEGEPHIADFGLAKRLDVASATDTGVLAGTVAYMSPQQAAGVTLDRRADIYGLGLIFYELLTGRQQFDETPLHERLAPIKSSEPVRPPREIDPAIPDQVEDVCLKCLEKDPDRRYSNALALRDDLICLLDNRSTSIVPRSFLARVLHHLRRNPRKTRRLWRTGAVLLTLSLLAVYTVFAAERAERSSLATNAFIANAQAGAALSQFREYADKLERTARKAEVVEVASSPQVVLDPPDAIKDLSKEVDSVFVVSLEGQRRLAVRSGLLVTEWPRIPVDLWERTYTFRDYFRGAQQLAQQGRTGAYVARALRSERDQELKFGISTPLYEGRDSNGVMVALIAADSAFGRLRMRDENGSGRVTALIGPRDVERGQQLQTGEPKSFVFLIHDGIRRGEEVRAPENSALRAASRLAAPPGEQFTLSTDVPRTEANYRDPVPGYEGLWHAAFAPIGATGYVMVVQSRKSATPSLAGALELLHPPTPWLEGGLAFVLILGLGLGSQRWRSARRNLP